MPNLMDDLTGDEREKVREYLANYAHAPIAHLEPREIIARALVWDGKSR